MCLYMCVCVTHRHSDLIFFTTIICFKILLLLYEVNILRDLLRHVFYGMPLHIYAKAYQKIA